MYLMYDGIVGVFLLAHTRRILILPWRKGFEGGHWSTNERMALSLEFATSGASTLDAA
jgi:hypothetical protein